MSTTSKTNGSHTIKSLAELSVLAPFRSDQFEPSLETAHSPELSELVAQLGAVKSTLETTVREDARARELAAIELARHQTLSAERAAAEQALADVRQVRAEAEQLAENAFSQDARCQATERAAAMRALELRCLDLLDQRTRTLAELERSPAIAALLAEQQRREHEQHIAAASAAAARAERLAARLASIDQSLSSDDLEHAQQMLEQLRPEFRGDPELRRREDIINWRSRRRLAEPAEALLRELARPPLRDDAEAAMLRLATLRTRSLPEDLARRVFGLWSNACSRTVQQRGWSEPRRAAPLPGRGVVWARPQPDAPFEVVSSLDTPQWQSGQPVPEQLACRAPLLKTAISSRTNAA